MSRSNLIVGLDVGTTKVAAIVGEMDETGVDVIGVGTHPTRGFRKGVTMDLENTIQAIVRAVEEAELRSRTTIQTVQVGITGAHIRGVESHGAAALEKGVVRKKDMAAVMAAAQAVPLPDDRDVIQVLPCRFLVDGMEESEPLNQQGIRLDVNCHVITAEQASVNNLIRCCREAGLTVESLVFEPVASSYSVLMPSERDRGVVLLDMGGGTLDMVVIRGGAVFHSAVITLGGHHVTAEIAKVLKVPDWPTAEELKKRHGVALKELARDLEIEAVVPGAREPRMITQSILADIIEHRMTGILRLASSELENSGFIVEAESVVFTGGCSLLPGVDTLAERIFGMPVRIGTPAGFGGRVGDVGTPIFATGVGLVLHAAEQIQAQRGRKLDGRRVEEVWTKVKEFFVDLF